MNEHDEIDDILKEIKEKSVDDILEDNDSIIGSLDDKAQSDTTEEQVEEITPEENETGFKIDNIDMPSDDDIVNEIMDIIESGTEETPVEHNFDEVSEELPEDYDNGDYLSYIEEPEKKVNKVAIIAIIVAVIVAIAVVATVVIKNSQKEPETTTTTTTTTTLAPVIYKNPLTGEDDYNKNADGKRPVAIVVENTYDARPQWGIDEEKSPDIIVEGEVEGGITRMLWLYADYTNLPDKIGPIRSARPPFINFSQLFDSIFIHWGMSYSKGDYVGANAVFKNNNVDHINQMKYNDTIGLYGRDSSRSVSSEHRGILHGDKVASAIEGAGFRTDANEKSFTKLGFNEKEKAVGETACNTLALTFSSNTKTRDWTYNAEDKTYHTSDYSSNFGSSDVSRKNLLILFDETTYVNVYNYHNSGNTTTYCNYGLAGGTGKLASLGTVVDINWSVENGVIVIKDTNGNKINLNTGKTWIGYASSNHNGVVTVG